MKRLSLVAAGLAWLSTAPAEGHHSFAAEFDSKQPVTLKGALTKMEWLNPHTWLHIDVAQPDGKVVNWSIESMAPNVLLRLGLRQTDFPAGTELTIEGYRARNGTPTASATTVKFADGRNFLLGAQAAPPK